MVAVKNKNNLFAKGVCGTGMILCRILIKLPARKSIDLKAVISLENYKYTDTH
jgi:hypothetical protein